MKCPNCTRDNVDTATFCTHCGTDFPQPGKLTTCPSCGARNDATALICSLCGTVFRRETIARTTESAPHPSHSAEPSTAPATPGINRGTVPDERQATATLGPLFIGALLLLFMAVFSAWFAWRMLQAHNIRLARDAAQTLGTAFNERQEHLALAADSREELEASLGRLAEFRDSGKQLLENPSLPPAERERVLIAVFRAFIDLYDSCNAAFVDAKADAFVESSQVGKTDAVTTPQGTLRTIITTSDGRELAPSEFIRESATEQFSAQSAVYRFQFITGVLAGTSPQQSGRQTHGLDFERKIADIAWEFGHSIDEIPTERRDAEFGADLMAPETPVRANPAEAAPTRVGTELQD